MGMPIKSSYYVFWIQFRLLLWFRFSVQIASMLTWVYEQTSHSLRLRKLRKLSEEIFVTVNKYFDC